MKDEDPLLKEILADEKLAALRQSSLDGALTALRRQRRARRAVQILVPLLVMAGLAAIFLRQPKPMTVASRPAARLPEVRTGEVAVVAAPEPGVRIVNDEELFALFPGRAVALIGKPGHRQFVLLDSRGK